MTLDDFERQLHVSFGAHHENLNEDSLILLAMKM